MKNRKVTAEAPEVNLSWVHLGIPFRITAWPEVAIERRVGEVWVASSVSEDALASGMLEIGATTWARYLEFLPAAERAFIQRFRYGRLAALLLIARCPQLVTDLEDVPALVPFLAAHASLRGTAGLRWDEIAAIYERGGVYSILEWLGLPACRETLSILQQLIDPDVPRCLLDPLRQLLWRPLASFVLRRSPELTERQLAHYCHALAA